ncbi:MAG: hypothetical protein GJU67_01575 [Ferrovum sp.]|jgi:3-deoxy-D-manno-octulosonate 8-phosphate phosphatase (KDO 8-P phosphatase)|nr:hypothetical protein [Ferrovum sp.]
MKLSAEDLAQRARQIRLVGFDVDGILTPGTLIFDEQGRETKSFHSRDGVGLKLLQQAGLTLALVTGRQSSIVTLRARELGITHVFQGVHDKRQVMDTLLSGLGLHWEQLAYMGDDLPDLSVLCRSALALTVPEAPEEIRAAAHWVAPVGGGMGATRAAATWLLQARGEWARVLERWAD